MMYNLLPSNTTMPNAQMYYTTQFLCGVQLCGAGAQIMQWWNYIKKNSYLCLMWKSKSMIFEFII